MAIGKPKTLTREASEAVRATARSLLANYDSKSALGRALGMTQGGISAFLLGKNDASLGTAQAVAKLAGVPLRSLVPDLEESGAQRPVYSSLPGWHTELELAKQMRPNMQPRGWGYAAQQNALFMMSVTAKDIIEAAEFWLRRASEHEQNEAAVERTEASLEAHEARQVEAQRRIAGMKARGEANVPSLAAMMKVVREEHEARSLADAKEKDAAPANDAPPPVANDTPAKPAPKKGPGGKRPKT